MKKIIILFLFLCFQIFPQLKSVKGIVFDSDSKLPLQSANILVKGTNIGTITDVNGVFSLNYNFSDSSIIIVSFIGYKTVEVLIANTVSEEIQIPLESKILPSQTILIEASVGKKGVTPISFDKISKEKISKDYVVQDVPDYLSQHLIREEFLFQLMVFHKMILKITMFIGWISRICWQAQNYFRFKEVLVRELSDFRQLEVQSI